jgi:hypothetical protein
MQAATARKPDQVRLDPGKVRHASHAYGTWFVEVRASEYELLFQPAYWSKVEAHLHTKLNRHDLIRVVAIDNSFDVTLSVVSRVSGAIQMRLLMGRPPGSDDLPEVPLTAEDLAALANLRNLGLLKDGEVAA